MYHLVYYIADFKDEIIVYTFKKSAFYNYFVNINYAESE